MGPVTLAEVARRALKETRSEVRLDSPVRLLVSLVSPVMAAALVWYATGNWAWTGIAGVALLLIIALGVFLVKLFTVSVTIANEARALLPIEQDDPRRDVGLTEAVTYAIKRQWGLRPMNLDADVFIDVTEPLAETRQRAADGELLVWGKRTEAGIYEAIPADYWRDHQVEWFDMLRGAPRTEKSGHAGSNETYLELMVSRAQFERLYPRN